MLYLKEFPLFLKLSILTIIVLSLFFVGLGAYLYKFNNGTSWNFGAMGMYSSNDYPGTRQAKIFFISDQNQRIFVGGAKFSSLFFVEYERFVSLPTKSNAKKLAQTIQSKLPFPGLKINNVSVELWVLEYDKNQKIVSSKKKLEFLI